MDAASALRSVPVLGLAVDMFDGAKDNAYPEEHAVTRLTTSFESVRPARDGPLHKPVSASCSAIAIFDGEAPELSKDRDCGAGKKKRWLRDAAAKTKHG